MAAMPERIPEVAPTGGRHSRRGRWRIVLASTLLVLATWAAAAELRADHPETYVVQKGDTLWDIAARFLQKPWLWPEIWQANPQIANPHEIYPGDVVSLAYLDRAPQARPQAVVAPGPRIEAPLPGVPLDTVRPFLEDLRVVDGFKNLPYVVGLEGDRLRVGQGQLAYAANLSGAMPGERYAILRPTQRYTHRHRTDGCCDLFRSDDLDERGRPTFDAAAFWDGVMILDDGRDTLGYELVRVANAVVTRGEGNGVEASTLLIEGDSGDVRIGDRILSATDAYDPRFFPHPPARQLDYGRAKVLSVSGMRSVGGPHDVVALSVGSREGVDNGTVFSIWRPGSSVVDKVRYGYDSPAVWIATTDRTRLPDEFAGHAMVFRTFDKVSYALVMDGLKPVRVGYEVLHPDAQ